MKKISLIYMSGADIAVPLFETLLHDSRFSIDALLTFPDKAKGRGQIIQESHLKTLAKKFHIPIIFNQDEVEETAIALSFAYGAILPSSFLNRFSYALNVHTSLLPKYRGASPIQEAILQGDQISGLSLMTMDAKMDTGCLWKQSSFSIAQKTAEEVFQKMAEEACHFIPNALVELSQGLLKANLQNDDEASYCQKINKNDGFTTFTEPANLLERKFFAYTPWPGLWSIWGGKRIKWTKIESSTLEFSKVSIHEGRLYIPCAKGSILVHECQPEGKKAMTSQSFQQGYSHLLQESFSPLEF